MLDKKQTRFTEQIHSDNLHGWCSLCFSNQDFLWSTDGYMQNGNPWIFHWLTCKKCNNTQEADLEAIERYRIGRT